LLTIEEIDTALRSRSPDDSVFVPDHSCASVAMIFVADTSDMEVCFIRRATRIGDPWSGQVAFPGGRASISDSCPEEVAERETREEVGLALKSTDRIGKLPIRDVQRRDLKDSLTLTPVLYQIPFERRDLAHAKNKDEVSRVFWVPVSHLFDEDAVTSINYSIGGRNNAYPGILYGEEVIWGLTLRILESFSVLLGRDLPAMRDSF
jgi:8-oxo-dGTP pyrophosphatase MutT (NUDIX family)